MRFVQFTRKDSTKQHLGVQLPNENVVCLSSDTSIPSSMIDFIQNAENIPKAEKILKSEEKLIVFPKSAINLMAPISKPDKVLCVGMNYHEHCIEQNCPIPEEPTLFNKFPSSITGPYDDIPYPSVTTQLDWETELVIVVGKKAKDVSKENAMDYVFGYTVAFDVSARDWQFQKNHGQWLVSKSMDHFCPIGPCIVTKDELKNPHALGIRCLVNGVIKQNSNTDQLVHKTEDIISYCSKLFTLLPGDIILTGTPSGVGVFKKPPEFLKKGDVVQCEIDEIGKIINRIV